MIYLTDKLAVTADSECYMVGRPVTSLQEFIRQEQALQTEFTKKLEVLDL